MCDSRSASEGPRFNSWHLQVGLREKKALESGCRSAFRVPGLMDQVLDSVGSIAIAGLEQTFGGVIWAAQTIQGCTAQSHAALFHLHATAMLQGV